MSYHDIIVAVYDVVPIENSGQFNYFKFVFDDNGHLEADLLRNLYKDLPEARPEYLLNGLVGPFADLVELNCYALKLCEKLEKKHICVYSADEYSLLIEKASSVEEFRELIVGGGNRIENLEYSKKGNFFKKLF